MWRDKNIQVFPLGFVLGVEKHLLESRIAEAHQVVLVLDDDSEWAVGNERVEVHGMLFDFLLGALSFRDIEGRYQDCRLAQKLEGAVREFQPTFFPVPGENFELKICQK